MTPLEGLPILTAAEMRAVEDDAIAGDATVESLMERAGAGIAEWAARLAGGAPILILCGPGNNGGDGYVTARVLRDGGAAVRVAAFAPPATDAARVAAAGWGGPVETMAEAQGTPVVVDALFGTGASRGVAGSELVADLIGAARLSIAVDLPSGLDADLGTPHGYVSPCDITLALGALKRAHVLHPGTDYCGTVRVIGIGLPPIDEPPIRVLRGAVLDPPASDAHKYSRGRVSVVAGDMLGASLLCATAALRAGAGYVTLLDGEGGGGPAALVRRPLDHADLTDPRGGTVVVGPGLGRDDVARRKLALALATPNWLVVDGDALRLIDPDNLPWRVVLTPHSGEFEALFGTGGGSKLDRTLAAAARCGCVVVHKGADTIIANPNGFAEVAVGSSSWLATAGSGDVLAGAIAARLAEIGAPFTSACDGVWLHDRAARLLGPSFIADDLAEALGFARTGA